MSRLRQEAGFTLIEVLLASVLSLVVFGATLTVFEALLTSHRRTVEHNDAQDRARTTVDRFARDLRNLASPTDLTSTASTIPNSMEKNGRYDVVFKTVDNVVAATPANPAGLRRVRYCLDSSNPAQGVLWTQEQSAATFTAAMPATAACPAAGGGWTTSRRVATNVVNRINGLERPVFSYYSGSDPLPYDAAASLPDTARIATDLAIDPTPNALTAESRLSSSVYLRNQNRRPTARFSWTWVVGCTVKLNGSASDDPEGEPLPHYRWSDNSPTPNLPEGIEVQTTLTPGAHEIKLRVEDPAGLFHEVSKTLTCSTSGTGGGEDEDG